MWRFLREVRKVEHLTPDEVKQREWDRLRAALVRASSLTYYSRLFQNLQIHPARVDRAAFERLPLLDKPTIRAHYGEMRSPRTRTAPRSTSGSTGMPFVFEKDADAAAYMDAVMYHVYSWHGIAIGAPQARFWGMPFARRAHTIARLKDLLMNRVRCNAFRTSEADLLRFYRRAKRFHPEYFYGYPSLIYDFARFVVESRLEWPLRLKGVIGTGELPLQEHRDYIERAFETRFVNEYGCSEVGIIAFQCTHGRMHVMAHNVLVEVVNNGRTVVDEEGEIVVTELNATTMPFLRYRMNDRGKLLSERCSCGLPLPLVDVSAGRIRGQLTLPSGRSVYDAIFSYTFKKGIAAFKAIQTAPADVHLYIVPASDFSTELMDHYIRVLDEKTFGEIRFAVNLVDVLPRERSGKLRYFVNEMTESPSRSADA